ncbi:MAG: AcrR family transcriptional regulator [Candidatus Pseudothioglobus sp.]|jgi:AcrR family transcriptional regulator
MTMNDTKRTNRKRERTRAALVNAARKLVFSRGHEKISIQDITDAADVGLGTFYNYFETKPMAFEAVLEEIRGQFTANLNKLREPLTDPATVMAFTLQYCFAQAQDNQEWNTFLAYSGLSGDYLLHQDEEQLLADIQRGVKAGRFKAEDVIFTQSLILGMVRHVNQEIRRGRLGRSAMAEATRHILRMLGLPDQVAKSLTQSPLPPVAVRRRNEVGENLRSA